MGDPPTGNFVALEEAFEEPKEQRRVLRLAEQGKLKVRLQEKLAALPIPEAAEAAWEEVERELELEPNPNAKTAFASTLPVPDDHPLTWLLVPPERCGELADTGTTTVRNLPFAEDPEQLAVFSEPKTIRLQDLWIDRSAAEGHHRKPHTAFIAHEMRAGTKRGGAWKALKQLASEAKGERQVALPGYGWIFLKRDRREPENAVRYKHDKFENPDDGELVKKGAFDRAWSNCKSNGKYTKT